MEKRAKKNEVKSGARAVNSFVWLLVGLFVVLGLLATGLFFAGNWLFYRNDHFVLRTLDLRENGPGFWGKRHAAVAARAGIRPGRDNLWKIDPAQVRARLLAIPAIATCEVRRVLPDPLKITISERIPRAAIENPASSRVLADDCVVLNRHESLQMPGTLPVIAGFGLSRAPAPGEKCPAAANALRLLAENLRNFPDISIIYISIAAPDKLDCVLRYRNRRSYRAILPAGDRYDYLLSALQSAIIDVLKNNDTRTTFDLSYRGQVVLQP